MITWVQKRFKDRVKEFTDTKEIDLWLHDLPGEVKHFSMIPMGTLVLAIAGYEPDEEGLVYILEEEEAIESAPFIDND